MGKDVCECGNNSEGGILLSILSLKIKSHEKTFEVF
jgi:hypothetical protein